MLERPSNVLKGFLVVDVAFGLASLKFLVENLLELLLGLLMSERRNEREDFV